jgi:hypothetical protein
MMDGRINRGFRMNAITSEAKLFKAQKLRDIAEARQTAAFFLACGVDLAAALATSGVEREAAIRRLERLIERERLRGLRRHWSYDLNRHIAMKQALDRLRR